MTQIFTTEMLQATNVRLVLFCCLLASFAIQGNKECYTVWFKQLLYSIYNFSAQNYIFTISASGVFYRICIYLCILIKRKECIYKTLQFISQFYLPYHKIGARVAILRSLGEWKLAYAAKKLRQYKINLLKLSPVVHAKGSHNASHSILGFMQFA